MIVVPLQRMGYLDIGTFGRLHLPEGPPCYTVEQPWRNNAIGISCIPEGEYECGPTTYYRGGYPAIEVREVPGRTRILIHVANWPEDVEGCIGVGRRLSCVDGRLGVTASRDTFRTRVMAQLGGLVFMLQVRGVIPAVWER